MNAKEPSQRALEDRISAEIAIRAGARLINTMMRQSVLASMLRPPKESLPLALNALPNLPAACSSPRSGGEHRIAEQVQTPAKGNRAKAREKIAELRQFRIGRIAVRPGPMVSLPAAKRRSPSLSSSATAAGLPATYRIPIDRTLSKVSAESRSSRDRRPTNRTRNRARRRGYTARPGR